MSSNVQQTWVAPFPQIWVLHHFAFWKLLVESRDFDDPLGPSLRLFGKPRSCRRRACSMGHMVGVWCVVLVVWLHYFALWNLNFASVHGLGADARLPTVDRLD